MESQETTVPSDRASSGHTFVAARRPRFYTVMRSVNFHRWDTAPDPRSGTSTLPVPMSPVAIAVVQSYLQIVPSANPAKITLTPMPPSRPGTHASDRIAPPAPGSVAASSGVRDAVGPPSSPQAA